MVSASTGAMDSVIGKLTALLGDEYDHLKGVKKGIRWLRDELSDMNAVLLRLADMEDYQIDVQTKEWRNKVRELSYDAEDCIDRFMRRARRGHGKRDGNFMRRVVLEVKMLWEDRQIGNEIQELKTRVAEESQRRDRYSIDQRITVTQHVPLDPRAHVLYQEAKNLVGIDEPREKIMGWIKDEEKQLKVVSIFGSGGLGKTTLAMEVYNKTKESFDCRAMVSVSRTPDIKKLLRDILFQINKSEYDESKEWGMEQLIPTLRKNFIDKRYFVIVDDIWSTEAWEHLKCALPINDNRSRIITTTRNKNVAIWCCTGFGEHMYEGKTLGEADSGSLFFRRVFSSEDCPPELMDVANKILRKCCGLPLAIISMAGLLANKTPALEQWIYTWNSISSAVDKEPPIDQMKRILSFSYFDLPQYLKTCLLYFSVFPEDYSIDTKHLVLKWIAEGLVTGKNQENMEQKGRSYLNELINRSMIQATDIGVNGTRVYLCRVHDVILDFIVSRAKEENFFTIFSANDFFDNPSNKIRRLSLQGIFSEGVEMPGAMKDLSHIRSFHMFGCERMQVPLQFLNCEVLQVVDIEDTDTGNLKSYHFEHIGRFHQLKYLKIKRTDITELSEQIGKLQHLETIDLTSNFSLKKLPSSIVQLRKLVRLFIPCGVPLPEGMENLQALEELSDIDLDKASVKSIEGLGELTKLRELRIDYRDYGEDSDEEGHKKVCISSLSKLLARSLRSLIIENVHSADFIDSWMISCGPSPPILEFTIGICWSAIPSQIGSLVNLTFLCAYFDEAGEEGLRILASLPVLLSLNLGLSPGAPHERLVVNSQGFQRLVEFRFGGKGLMFEAGAMPKLQRLDLLLDGRGQLKYGGLVPGLRHLSGLKSIGIIIDWAGAVADEVMESWEDEVRGAALVLPNRPILEIKKNR